MTDDHRLVPPVDPPRDGVALPSPEAAVGATVSVLLEGPGPAGLARLDGAPDLQASPVPPTGGWWSRHGHELRATALYCLQVLVVTLLVINFVGRVSIVQGGSMEPSIVTGERIIVNLMAYDFGMPRRGDVIVFRNPRDVTKDYIKRVVGLPGDSVELRAGVTYLNGRPFDEPYVTHHDYSDTPLVRLKSDEIFVMGDNRANSEDSRRWGALPLRLVRGKASVVFWPPDRVSVFP